MSILFKYFSCQAACQISALIPPGEEIEMEITPNEYKYFSPKCEKMTQGVVVVETDIIGVR